MSLEKITVQTGNNPKLVIIWMHGLGADGHDFEPVVPQFTIENLDIKFVFPHAPKIPVTLNGGMVMRAWYDIKMMDIQKHADKAGVEASEKLVLELIEEQLQKGFSHQQIILAGFSQGGAMSLQVSTNLKDKIAGIIALSSYLPVPEKFDKQIIKANLNTPIFMGHGTQDPMVPHSLGVASRKRLQQAGYSVDWHEYPIQHGVNLDELMDIKKWIIKNFSN
jgi:phospholipase/carboxylesterase